MKIVTQPELQRLMQAVNRRAPFGQRDYYLIQLLAHTGLRVGEVVALNVGDVEEAWNQKTKQLLGLEVKSPLEGVLQDIHWAWGEFGYFPTYTLGNLYGATLFAAARRALPSLEVDLARGHLLGLRDWLREKVHRQGARLDAEDLVRSVTGHGLRDDDFIESLAQRY